MKIIGSILISALAYSITVFILQKMDDSGGFIGSAAKWALLAAYLAAIFGAIVGIVPGVANTFFQFSPLNAAIFGLIYGSIIALLFFLSGTLYKKTEFFLMFSNIPINIFNSLLISNIYFSGF